MEITKREYVGLKVSEAKLNQLEINGVDNWQNYGCMCEWNDDR
jgi:homoserine trans-succinylase